MFKKGEGEKKEDRIESKFKNSRIYWFINTGIERISFGLFLKLKKLELHLWAQSMDLGIDFEV